MSVARRFNERPPVRSMLSDLPAPPGVYRSRFKYAQRWVYYALGIDAELLHAIRPADDETDDEVVHALRDMMRDEPRIPALRVLEAHATGRVLDVSFPRPFALPRLALVPAAPPPSRR